MATLDLIDVTKRFGGVTAVNTVQMRVADGEFMCILGPSGCGKSTLLRMVAGFEMPTSGDIRIDADSVTALPPNRRPTAMVFQKYTLWPHMRVFDNIAFGLRLRGLGRADIQRKVEEALALVNLSGYEARFPAQLSGGQQQRVALARAIVLEPKILLLDEPFSSLDAILRVRLREELRRIQRRLRITAIFVTHDQEEALTLADRIAVMNEGRVEQIDQPSQIYAHPATLFVADFIGVMNLVPAVQEGDQLRIGHYRLSAGGAPTYHGPVTVAIRPEDFVLTSADTPNPWSAVLEQVIDLGHYRKALVASVGVPTLKLYLPKTQAFSEGESIAFTPARYLIYREDALPFEVKLNIGGDALRVETIAPSVSTPGA